MTRCLMLLSVIVLVFAGVTSAAVKQGDTELDFLAGFTMQNGAKNGADFDAWSLSGAIGYFLTDNIQVQAAAMGTWTSTTLDMSPATDIDFDVDTYGLGLRAKYHFMPTNQWVPYVGLQFFWASASVDTGGLTAAQAAALEGDADGTLWGPVFGLRYELNENNDFYVEYEYQMWSGDIDDLFDDGHALLVGIIHQFK